MFCLLIFGLDNLCERLHPNLSRQFIPNNVQFINRNSTEEIGTVGENDF